MNDRLCTVCGYEMEEGPRAFNICPSCGTEFGLHDLNSSVEELRELWVASGPRWHSTVLPRPQHWEPITQLTVLFLNQAAENIAVQSYQAVENIEVKYYTRRRRRSRASGIAHATPGLAPAVSARNAA